MEASKAFAYRVVGFRRIPRDQLYSFMKENGIPTEALESGKRKLLIVDDDVELVELMVDVFARDGRFEIKSANNGFGAGMLVKEFRPDLVILDVMLPDINGKEVCQRVRNDPLDENGGKLSVSPEWWSRIRSLICVPLVRMIS